MKLIAQGYEHASVFVLLNMDRFLVPLLIMAALALGGIIFSYVTVH